MRTLGRKSLIRRTMLVLGLLVPWTLANGNGPDRPVQSEAPPPYEAGVMRMEVVDHSSPFDVIHGINVGPRILVGDVFYPIEPGSGGATPITLAYYYDSPEAYARTLAAWFRVPAAIIDIVLGKFGTSVAEHLATQREGIYANAPLAEGSFPIILLFGGSGTRGHQPDDLAREYAKRGYIIVALDAPGVTRYTPIGGALESDFTDLLAALGAISCDQSPQPQPCFDPVNHEYYAVDRGKIVGSAPFVTEEYIVQRAYDGVAMIESVEDMFGDRVDDSRVGIVGISLDGPLPYIAPMLIDALRGGSDNRYSGYSIVSKAFAVNTVGMDDGNGGLFGEAMGAILCQGDSGCDPLKAVSHITKPVGFAFHVEDQVVGGRESSWYLKPWPGYGPGLTDATSLWNRWPNQLISFEAIPEGVPSIWVEVPNSDHMHFTTDPLFALFDTILYPDLRVFTGEPYTPLDLEQQIEILAHYSVGFFDLTLEGKRGSLGALKTGRYNNVTEDGRDVVVRTKSLETVLH